ncbi:unnamed protein product [Arabidopsis arenosa]|uniref:Uncharacterized protein n=1 Tax=Arabidopsis arenosa TaxID=38785 RepID=A0A8S2ATJ3_ARAAE|nr:unnamed protein product [Arabidopsis arenosa]
MSNTNEQENATRTNVKRKRFTEMEVDMIMPDPSPKGNNYYSAFEMNLECAKKVPSTNRDQRATFYLGGICCLFPGIAEELQAAVRSMGRRLTIIKIPSDAARNGLTVPPKIMDGPKARAIFGYLVIMLYKNVNESNFREFSNKRLKALRAVASCIEKGYISVFNDVEDAICYRNSYGQNHQIRKAVLSTVLDTVNGDRHFSSVSLYVANFLSWTDMAGYHVVEECLVYPDSPVLKAPELATEVSNWKKADQAIMETDSPQYYRILHEDPASCSILRRANFPTLIAVAEKLKNRVLGGSNKVVNAERSDQVDYYYDMHVKYYASGGVCEATKRILDYFEANSESIAKHLFGWG